MMYFKKKKKNVAGIISLICYIICIIVLIVEASMDGSSSASQSNAVGGSLANFFNDIKGDQTVAVAAEDLNITNKITTGYVGDKYTLEIETLPADSTYKSVVYKSSNSKVASINNNGVITFVNPGHVTIEAINEKYTSIKDSIDIDVYSVDAEKIEATIENATKDDNNIYTIYLSNEYTIKTTFTPQNTTYKDVTYEYDESYLDITENGKIIPKKYSANNPVNITVKHNDLSYTLKTIIDHKDVIQLQKYEIACENSIYVSQSYTPKITAYPNDATFKEYELISSNPNVLQISSNKNIVGKSSGEATLTVKSKIYSNISSTYTVKVLPQPQLENITLSDTTLYINESVQLNYKKVPQYAQNPSTITYESLNNNIVTVTNTGVIKGINEGTTTIKVTVNNQITQQCKVTVLSNQVTGNENFKINLLKDRLYYGVEYNINDVLEITDWEPSDILGKDKISYSLKDSSSGEVTTKKITLNELGEHQLFVTHTLSGKTNSINLTCTTFDFDVIDSYEGNQISLKELKVNEAFVFNLIDEEIDTFNQYYEVTTEDTNIISLSSFGDRYNIKALDEGIATLYITPYINDKTDNRTQELKIKVSHVYSTSIDFSIVNNNTNKVVILDDNTQTLDVYINSNYSIHPIIDVNATIYETSITSSNEEVLTISANGKMNFNSIGTSTVTIKENKSNKTKTFTINIYNLIELNKDNPFTLEGKDAEVTGENTYSIRNGHSGKISLNFTAASTYTTVTYSSSDPKVANIGQDGTITPNRMGTTTITIICDDGMNEKIEVSIKLTIKRTDYIQDLNEFFYQVRKGLGHFSAFLILGIFSTLTYCLFLNNAKLLIGIPLNFGSGFFMAVLTEYIQTLVPGRYGCAADVFLDYDGFLVSSSIITAIFVIVAIFRARKNYIINR